MNRLIIIGNGFDLSLGLRTGYKHFLFDYFLNSIRECFSSDSDTVDLDNRGYKYQDNLIKISIPESWNQEYTEAKLREICDYNGLVDVLNEYDMITSQFDLLTKILQLDAEYSWIDLEVMYYDQLVKISQLKSLSNRDKQISLHNARFSELKDRLIQYIAKIDSGFHPDSYLSFSHHYTEPFFNPHPKSQQSGGINAVQILNFNYTTVLESTVLQFGKSDYQNVRLNYIHGEVRNPKSIIFGFGDEHDKNYQALESERNSELFRNIKSAHYFRNSAYKILNGFINADLYEVFIIGHSCGISDRTLLNEIFEHENCDSVRIFHRKIESGDDFLDKSIEIMRHFKDKVGMRNKICEFYEGDEIIQYVAKS
ncbi:MAG: hypothetical protein HN686_06670 [Bacteroidetes bacterium]|jgi:hypothetical protein|nr:hypothetical protein [Bacteroidota bacterium]